MKTLKGSRRRSKYTLLALALGAAVVAGPVARAATQPDGYEVARGFAAFPGWADAALAGVALKSGRALLNDLQDARGALNDGRIGQARRDLASSEQSVQAVEQLAPRVAVMDEVRDFPDRQAAGDLTVVHADLLPIYRNLDELRAYATEGAKPSSRGHAAGAGHRAREGGSDRAGAMSEKVRNVVATGTVYLPVDEVATEIRVARQALDRTPVDVAGARGALEHAVRNLPAMLTGEFVTPHTDPV